MMRLALLLFAATLWADELENGWKNPPPDARPHAYWLWLNGYVDPATARAELQAMKDAGFSGVLLFDMGARGDKSAIPPAGPAFLSPDWMKNFRDAVGHAKQLGLQVDFSVISSWDLGGHWIQPKHASMGLYPVETEVDGGKIDVQLPFPPGKPAVWVDTAVLAVRNAKRGPGHEFVIKLDPPGDHVLREVVLDNGNLGTAPITATMTPTREFSFAVSSSGTRDADFREVARGSLPATPGPQRFPLPAGTRGRYVRLRLLSGHDAARPRWTLGEFSLVDTNGVNVAAARVADTRRNGALLVRSTAPLGYDNEWNLDNLRDGSTTGPGGVFASAGPPPFNFSGPGDLVDVTSKVDREGRLRWDAPAGKWTILRYVCMSTGERLKVPSPNSDGLATDHLSAEATRAHMDYVIERLRGIEGVKNLYLASYEVRGPVWSPTFQAEFQKRRGYSMSPYMPAIFGARVGSDEMTERFLFDYRKTLGEVLVDAYYVAARESAHKAGMGIKSEAGGPGPPVHNVPVDSLLANNAVDEIQGEFWPFWPKADGLWVVKETAAAGHVYGKPRVHMEAFTSFEGWREGPQDLKPSADRVFVEGGNHFVWHTWSHAPPDAGKPGWVYLAGTHINRNVTWWPKARPFIDYLSRGSFLLQRGRFVADILHYYGDGGYKFVGPRKTEGGYDYDVANSDVILNRLSVRNGRFVLPDGTSYSVLVLPDSDEAHPAVLAKIEQFVKAGGVVIGRKPVRAVGLEGYPASDARVREIASRLKIEDTPVLSKLRRMGVPPDFAGPETLDWIHRRDGDADIYFIRNTTDKPVAANVTLRVKNRTPELWDPVTGKIATAAGFRRRGELTEVLLQLAENGSVFVVFRSPATADGAPLEISEGTGLPISGPWDVRFDDGTRRTMSTLGSWTEDTALQHFAGSAKYTTKFEVPAGYRSRKVELDLGGLWTIGEVWLNGKSLGVVWTAPWHIDVTDALREGSNELVVEVINTWYNRLIGDSALPPEKRTTRTNVTTSGGVPWSKLKPLPSGLFGPVRLILQ